MTPKEFRRKLEKIQRRFEEIEETLNELPEGLREEVREFHNPDATLQYCTRWGLQASTELVEAYEEVHEKASENYDI
jgi:nitrogenase molybdenum-iron protein alpha/beta subunit